MRNKDLVQGLTKLVESDTLDREEEKLVRDAIGLLSMSMVSVLACSYKRGFFDGYANKSTSNHHVVANQNANAYALEVLRANEKIG